MLEWEKHFSKKLLSPQILWFSGCESKEKTTNGGNLAVVTNSVAFMLQLVSAVQLANTREHSSNYCVAWWTSGREKERMRQRSVKKKFCCSGFRQLVASRCVGEQGLVGPWGDWNMERDANNMRWRTCVGSLPAVSKRRRIEERWAERRTQRDAISLRAERSSGEWKMDSDSDEEEEEEEMMMETKVSEKAEKKRGGGRQMQM